MLLLCTDDLGGQLAWEHTVEKPPWFGFGSEHNHLAGKAVLEFAASRHTGLTGLAALVAKIPTIRMDTPKHQMYR